MVSNTLLGILSQELVVGFEVSVEILHYNVKWVLFREPYLLAIYIMHKCMYMWKGPFFIMIMTFATLKGMCCTNFQLHYFHGL